MADHLPLIHVYTRRGCHLCELLLDDLQPLIRGRAEVVLCDVDTREDWKARYTLKVPVVEIGGSEICHYQLDRAALEAALARF